MIKEQKFKILIDHRENHSTSDVHNITPKFDAQGIEYEMKQLSIGDYVVENKSNGLKFCVERKIWADLVGSIFSGRIFNELFKMSNTYSKNFLIVIGSPEEFEKERAKLLAEGRVKELNPFTRNHVLGIMSSVAARYENVEMIFLKNDEEFIQFLLMIAEKLTDGRDIKGMSITHAKHKDNMYRNVLMAIPGISEEKAKAVEKVYPDFSSLRKALNDGSFKVEGIGQKTTGTFLNVFCL